MQDMERLRKDLVRQMEEEKLEKKNRDRYRKDFYEEENRRIKENEIMKKRKLREEQEKD